MANTHSIDLETGSNQYLSVADTAPLSVTGSFTVEMWVKPESAPGATVRGLFSKWDDGATQRGYGAYYILDGGTTLKLRLLTVATVGGSASTSDWTLDLGTATWKHLAFVYSTTGPTATLYLDGVSQGAGSGTPAASIADNTAPFTVGSFGSGAEAANQCWDGLIDDVRVWSTARTGTEINDNKNAELVGNESGLVGYWKLNNALTDSTANAATLTNNNSATFSADVPTWTIPFSVSDTVTAVETVTALRTRLFSTLDTLSVVESITAALGRIFSASDTATASEVVTALRSRIFSALDTLSVTEPYIVVKKLWETVARVASSFSKPSRTSETWSKPDNPNT